MRRSSQKRLPGQKMPFKNDSQISVVYREQSWGGGVKGSTYVLTLGIASYPPISKDVPPHSMIPKLFTRRGLAR